VHIVTLITHKRNDKTVDLAYLSHLIKSVENNKRGIAKGIAILEIVDAKELFTSKNETFANNKPTA